MIQSVPSNSGGKNGIALKKISNLQIDIFCYSDFCHNERNGFSMLNSKQGNVLNWLRVFCEVIEGLKRRRGKFEWVFFRTVTLESSLAWA